MPKRPPRACPHPGCPNLNCTTHRRKHQDKRPSAAKRGYNHKWRIIRLQFLRANPLCAKCNQAAKDIHHLIPKADGGTNRWSNLQALCHSCHSKETQREKRRGGRGG